MDLVGILSVFVFSGSLFVEALKCDFFVDITDGSREGNTITKNGVSYTPENYFEDHGTVKGCICSVIKCVRKCCADGEAIDLITRKCVQNEERNFVPNFSLTSIIHVPENKICEESEVKIKVDEDFYFENGMLVWDNLKFAKDDFCLAVTPENETYAIACVTNEEAKVDRFITCLGMLISMPFLLATFLVYVILPDSSIHKRALMFYVLTLLLAYICLVTVQLRRSDSTPIADVPCKMLGYSIIFFFIVSFCWLNVMCIDMWLAFSGLTRFAASKTAETKRFLYYCAYAWGTPLILILIIFLLNRMENTRSIFHPRLGIGKCFIEDGYPNLFYFYLPMAILITINIVLFTLTALKIQQVKRETLVLKQNDSKRHTYEDDKQKFNLYLKLMLAMGINWTTEVISWLINWQTSSFPTEVWYVTDFANAAYGAFIFFIFVFKKKIWIQLKKRYYILMGKPHRAHALSTTSGARSSGMSTTVTHLHQSEIRMNNLHNRTNDERPLREN